MFSRRQKLACFTTTVKGKLFLSGKTTNCFYNRIIHHNHDDDDDVGPLTLFTTWSTHPLAAALKGDQGKPSR